MYREICGQQGKFFGRLLFHMAIAGPPCVGPFFPIKGLAYAFPTTGKVPLIFRKPLSGWLLFVHTFNDEKQSLGVRLHPFYG